MNSIKTVLSQFKDTYMLLMDYASIGGGYLPDYSKFYMVPLACMHTYMHILKYQLINIQDIDYKPSQYFNTNVQT